MLANKRIVVAVTGSIAAYKSADLIRRLREAGAECRVILSAGGAEFITALTLQAVSGHPVLEQLLDVEAEAGMGHIELARWADIVLVAPASADTLAKLVQGRGDDLLGAVCLATQSTIAVAPAMNQAMWADPATQANIDTLNKRGIKIWGPAEGEQACGEIGSGRMLEPSSLVDCCVEAFNNGSLAGVQITITAGPTREPLDPMRYISNRSSGKMGYALASACIESGARVSLVSGPVCLAPPDRVQLTKVETAAEMLTAAETNLSQCDIFIACAAVADYRPAKFASQKIKKSSQTLALALEPTEDILQVISTKSPTLFTVGFAAETDNIAEYAQAKLVAKSLNMIAANRIGQTDTGESIGVDSDDNALQVFWPGGEQTLALTHKTQLARQLVDLISQRYHENKNTT